MSSQVQSHSTCHYLSRDRYSVANRRYRGQWQLLSTLLAGTIALSMTLPAVAKDFEDKHMREINQGANDNYAGDEYSNPALRPEIMPGPEKPMQSPQDGSPSPNYSTGASTGTQDSSDPPPTRASSSTGTLLQATASVTDMVCHAEMMTSSPLSRYRGEQLSFFRVSIRNTGQGPVLVLGRETQSDSTGGAVKAIGAGDLEKKDNTLLSPHQKALVAAVGIGTAGLASSIFYEVMTPSENRNRNRGIALGRDRGRHEVEGEHLGTRLIMPGDETSGWVAFNNPSTLKPQEVQIPIMFPPYTGVSATLKIPVVGTVDVPPDVRVPTTTPN